MKLGVALKTQLYFNALSFDCVMKAKTAFVDVCSYRPTINVLGDMYENIFIVSSNLVKLKN